MKRSSTIDLLAPPVSGEFEECAEQGRDERTSGEPIKLEKQGLIFTPGNGSIHLVSAARAALTARDLTRTPSWMMLRRKVRQSSQAFHFGPCGMRRLQLPALEGWRLGPPGGKRNDDAVIVILHRRGAMRFTNSDGPIESLFLIALFLPEYFFKSDEMSDRISLYIPTQLTPNKVRQVVHLYVLYRSGNQRLPALCQPVTMMAMEQHDRLRPVNLSRLQRILVHLVADLIAARKRVRLYRKVSPQHQGVAEVAAKLQCSLRQFFIRGARHHARALRLAAPLVMRARAHRTGRRIDRLAEAESPILVPFTCCSTHRNSGGSTASCPVPSAFGGSSVSPLVSVAVAVGSSVIDRQAPRSKACLPAKTMNFRLLDPALLAAAACFHSEAVAFAEAPGLSVPRVLVTVAEVATSAPALPDAKPSSP